MKYNVGNRVRIKSLDWYNANKSKSHGTVACGSKYFEYDMREWCGKTMTILEAYQTCYIMREDGAKDLWTDEMIEGLVEEETKPKFKVGDKITNGEITFTILRLSSDRYGAEDTFGECGSVYFKSQDEWKIVEEKSKKKLSDESWRYKNIFDPSQYPQSFECPDGYVFKNENGNVINATKIVLEKKKKEYPKTYEDCCTVLRFHYDHYLTYDDEKDINPTKEEEEFIDLMDVFSRLIVCRNAYWKIYGEEIGLGKPWEPDWNDDDTVKYCIIVDSGIISKQNFHNYQFILAFPTAEMRDAFYENFKSEIEICKELL